MKKPRNNNSNPHQPKRGTKEWSAHSLNLATGCANGCLYCYARDQALRFGRIESDQAWSHERLRSTPPAIKKYAGVVMFPTTHDITPYYLEGSVATLRGMLELGNQILVVSKPHFTCIERICREFAPFRDQILFRFSIGSLDHDLAAFWEPGAPSILERLFCLNWALGHGFQTSVSMEPMLAGADDAIATYHALSDSVTDKVWIGKMNQVRRRVPQDSERNRPASERILGLQCDSEILRLYHELKSEPKVAWKDSVLQVVQRTTSTPNTKLNRATSS